MTRISRILKPYCQVRNAVVALWALSFWYWKARILISMIPRGVLIRVIRAIRGWFMYSLYS